MTSSAHPEIVGNFKFMKKKVKTKSFYSLLGRFPQSNTTLKNDIVMERFMATIIAEGFMYFTGERGFKRYK